MGGGSLGALHMQVWDIRNNRCLQTMTDKQQHRPEDALTCLLYDPKEKQLLSGSVLPKVPTLILQQLSDNCGCSCS